MLVAARVVMLVVAVVMVMVIFVVEVLGLKGRVSWVGGRTCWLVYMMSWSLMALMPYFLCCTQEKCHHGQARGGLYHGEDLVPGDHEGVHVGDAAPWGQDAVPALEADDLPHLLEALVLHQDEDRGDLVGEHVSVGGGGEPLAGQGGHVQATGQLVEEARMAWGKQGSEQGGRHWKYLVL